MSVRNSIRLHHGLEPSVSHVTHMKLNPTRLQPALWNTKARLVNFDISSQSLSGGARIEFSIEMDEKFTFLVCAL